MESSTAVVSGDEAAHSTHQDPLYAMPELAQICHFCLTFQAPLKLPSFSRTDLQAALIAGTTGDDREVSLLAELHFKLVREQGAKLERMIQDWEKAVIRKVTDNWRLEFSSNPFDGATYDELSVAQRIQIMNVLCHWKLESCAEIHKHLAALQKESDSKALDALRATPIGYDDSWAAYWYFGDRCWVYAEERPTWQSQALQEYTVEFADAKRIRLSINFDPTGSVSSPSTGFTRDTVAEANGAEPTERMSKSKLQISTIVDEEIDEDEEDEPLPTENKVKEEVKDELVKTNGEAVEPITEVVKEPEVKKESAKMNIDMLCSSVASPPSADDSQPKSEPMEEDEHDVSEDRFMSTIVSKRDPVVEEVTVKEPPATPLAEPTSESSEPPARENDDAKKSPTKKRVHEDAEDEKKPAPEPVEEVVPKRRKTRFHDITWATDNTTAVLVDKVNPAIEAPPMPIEKEKTTDMEPTAETQPVTDNDGQAEDFEILCAACKRSYDRRYLDPPLDKRPMGEWRCFECLVNDARGWPRRRPSSAKSPKAADGNDEEDEKATAKKKSSSSSSKSKSKSSGGSSKGSSKKSSSSRSSSSSKHKKSSSSSTSSKKSSKKKKSSSSSSSSKHSSSRHHRHHREEYASLLKLAHGRKRERLAIEEARLDGTHLCPVPLDGPSGWRVVCSSVEGLRQVTEQLVGGSLEQDRLRGRLIMILKVEEKQELERLKKQEQHLWQGLPRRQSSRVAIGRMRSQNNSDESGADESGGDDRAPASERRSSRSSRTRGGGDGQARLALERESRARRRRRDDDSGSESESDGANDEEPSVEGWITWAAVKGENSLAMVCSGAVDRLLKEEIAELFARPVDPVEDGCPDYLTVIAQPMDLGTIKQRVDDGFYTSWDLFKMDVDRVWSNCRKYNSPDMAVVEYADTLDQMFKMMRKEAERNGVRKMKSGDAASVNGKQLPDVGSDDDEDDAAKSSGDESVRKAKSDSSASEVSSIESDDSSEASSGDSDAGGRAAARKTRQAASSRPARSASSSKPARPTRSAAPSSRGKTTRRRKANASDSEEEEEADSHSESEEEEAESDDSEDNKRKRGSRKPTPPPQRRGSTSSLRSDNRPTTGGKQPMSAGPPPGEASVPASASETAKRGAHRNRIVSSDSSSSDESMKRDSSSSEEDSDDEANGTPARPPHAQPPRPEPASAAPAPPPPASPPPPTPPVSGSVGQVTPTPPTRGGRKPKPVLSRQRGAQHAGSDSSSSYFSSSESESSGDSSDSDSD